MTVETWTMLYTLCLLLLMLFEGKHTHTIPIPIFVIFAGDILVSFLIICFFVYIDAYILPFSIKQAKPNQRFAVIHQTHPTSSNQIVAEKRKKHPESIQPTNQPTNQTQPNPTHQPILAETSNQSSTVSQHKKHIPTPEAEAHEGIHVTREPREVGRHEWSTMLECIVQEMDPKMYRND